jgi:hypothetical protein
LLAQWTPLSSIDFNKPKALLSQTASSISNWKNPGTHSAQMQLFFDQVFSASKPTEYSFPALAQSCSQANWPSNPAEERYLKCGGMAAGLTSIVSQVKVCFKMAIDTGSNMVLPAMPLRDSTDLTDFNFFNSDAYMTYDKWFDLEHMVSGMARACPKMKIIHPDQLDTEIPVKHTWNVEIGDAPGYHFPIAISGSVDRSRRFSRSSSRSGRRNTRLQCRTRFRRSRRKTGLPS